MAAIGSAQNLHPGNAAPKFNVKDIAGREYLLSNLMDQGSPTFLYFINIRDNTSRQASSYINKIIQNYTPSPTKWFGIVNAPEDKLRSYQSEMSPPYQLLMDEGLNSMQIYHAKSSPTIVEIDKSGNVMHTWQGFSASNLKSLNRAVAAANGKRVMEMDFSRAPSTVVYGDPFIKGEG